MAAFAMPGLVGEVANMMRTEWPETSEPLD